VEDLFKELLFQPKEKPKKKRSQADKVGKLKHLLAKDKKLDCDVAEIKLLLKVFFAGLKDSLH
jgi:hypothetical protein